MQDRNLELYKEILKEVWGIPVTVSLVRGGAKVYRNALPVLLIGALSAGIQMVVSQRVRGASAPVNVRFYVTAFTLVVFLLLRLPPLWKRADLLQPMKGGGSKAASAATALIVCGAITLTTPIWAGPTHLSATGYNWVNVLQVPLVAGGWGMVLAGAALLFVCLYRFPRPGRLHRILSSSRKA